ncbi:MAG TPA: XdhC family protein [Beijerinckiaceae bacterium]|nr:XdhC family protein [Beijerinckiaceae bacterium]
MTRTELSEMIALAERLASIDEPAVLSTLFSSRGSTYRPLGAMMVSGPPPMLAGGVSGGCLEQYIARHGRSLTEEHAAAILSFDADPDAEDRGRPVLGCGGAIEVLVERFTPEHLAFLKQIHAAHCGDSFSTAACILDTSRPSSIHVRRMWIAQRARVTNGAALERLLWQSVAQQQSRFGELDSQRRALIHYIRPLTRLVIFGAGDDVRPLCTLASSVGWHVTIADRRARLATQSRFPDADDVIAYDWASAVEQIVFTPNTAIVMMTHSLPDDIEILPLLINKKFAYIGALGPAHRRRWLLEGVEKTTPLPEEFSARIRGPIGLNLGDRTAMGIAVSIVAEILADLNGRTPSRLSSDEKKENLRNEELVPNG